MAHILDIPIDVLTTIMIMLATSYDGARDVARMSATCPMFREVAWELPVLKVVNFESLTPTEDYEAHHRRNGLLCLCAQAGNPAAESMLGKALLYNDAWFWNINMEDGQPLIARNGPGSGVLLHERLVRSLIVHGSCEDVAPLRIPLFSYMISFLGYEVARECGILLAVTNMCSYEIILLNLRSVDDEPERSENNSSVNRLNEAMARLAPPSGGTHRDRLLALFDEQFPLSRPM